MGFRTDFGKLSIKNKLSIGHLIIGRGGDRTNQNQKLLGTFVLAYFASKIGLRGFNQFKKFLGTVV